MLTVFAKAGITDTLRVDKDLKFLNGFVDKQIAAGGRRYDPPDTEDRVSYQPRHVSTLQTEHRKVGGDNQESLVQMRPVDRQSGAAPGPGFDQSAMQQNYGGQAEEPETSSGLRIKGKAKAWGPTGYNDGTSPPVDDAPMEPDYSQVKVTTIQPENHPGRVQREKTPPAHVQQQPARLQVQKSEKELMAEALFTGGGAGASLFGGSKKGTRRKRNIRKKKQNARARKSASQASNASSGNNIANSNANNTDDSKENEMNLNQAPPQQDASAVDLLDFGGNDTNTQATGQQDGQLNQGGGDDIFDLLGYV